MAKAKINSEYVDTCLLGAKSWETGKRFAGSSKRELSYHILILFQFLTQKYLQ